MRIVVGISLVVALIAACSGCAGEVGPIGSTLTTTTSAVASSDAPQSTAPPITTTTTTLPTSPTALRVPEQLAGWPVGEVVLDGARLQVAVAATPDRQRQGLMGVDDLGGLDGMLFVWTEDTTTSFWMKDTLIPLDIAFFTANGDLVGMAQMEPCVEEPCPLYGADAAFRYALETAAGRLANLPGDARLDYQPAG